MRNGLVLALLILAGCGAQSAAERRGESMTEPWTFSLLSSGGFSGAGAGNVHVASDGSVTAGNLRGRDAVAQLSDAEKKKWNAAVAAARNGPWTAPADNGRGADMIVYEMKLQIGSRAHAVKWREDVTPQLPPELRALYDLAVETRNRTLTPR